MSRLGKLFRLLWNACWELHCIGCLKLEESIWVLNRLSSTPKILFSLGNCSVFPWLCLFFARSVWFTCAPCKRWGFVTWISKNSDPLDCPAEDILVLACSGGNVMALCTSRAVLHWLGQGQARGCLSVKQSWFTFPTSHCGGYVMSSCLHQIQTLIVKALHLQCQPAF